MNQLVSQPSSQSPAGVVGAGTMGAGIAQVAAVAGRRVLIADAAPGAADRAVGQIRDRVKAAVAKGRLTVDPEDLDVTAASVADFTGCDVVVEAIVEDLAVKRRLFADLERVVSPDCVLASNSSSLSPTAMARGWRIPGGWWACTSSTPFPRCAWSRSSRGWPPPPRSPTG